MLNKILFVIGTRPEAIKMAPVINAFKRYPKVDRKVLISGQHEDLVKDVLKLFDIPFDHDLKIMVPNQSLTQSFSKIVLGLDEYLKSEGRPDLILVHGDTLTALGVSLVSFFNQTTLGHVEAGLRTYVKYDPFPEEISRCLIDSISDFHFAPTERAYDNLIKEGKNPDRIVVTGNSVIDALLYVSRKDLPFENKALEKVDYSKKLILVTTHRRESFGTTLEGIHQAISQIVQNFDVEVVFPVHPNPNVRKSVEKNLTNLKGVHLVEPLSYRDMVGVLKKSYLVLTDSGGLQEEAPALGKPVLVLRKTTERPEGIEAGTVRLVGTNKEDIIRETRKLLEDSVAYKKMSQAVNPYGDGSASEKIVAFVLKNYDK